MSGSLGEGKAEDGAWALAYALDGYRETMTAQGRETRVNVNAHSYGTNTAAYALTRITHPVDSYTMYGSAGIDENAAEHASELNVAITVEGRPAVYATDAGNDGLSDLGKNFSFRADPSDTAFGAYVFSSDGTGNPPGYSVSGHYQTFGDDAALYGYRDEESQAYESLVLINDGCGDEVDGMTETTEEYYQSLAEHRYDQHVTQRVADDSSDYSLVPETELEVTLDGQSHRVDTREEAVELISDYYAGQAQSPAQGDS